MFKFSLRSMENLKAIHPHLQIVAHKALEITPIDFGVISGLRTPEQQHALVNKGKSKTQNSRHLTGHAMDVAVFLGSEITWDVHYYKQLHEIIYLTAQGLNIPLEWGGDWHSFKDYGHYQLPWSLYPVETQIEMDV